MNTIKVKCSNCGRQIQQPGNIKQAFACPFCKHSILLGDPVSIKSSIIKKEPVCKWSDLPCDKFFSFVNSSQIMNSSDYAKSEVRQLRDYLSKCYENGTYYLSSLDFLILQDKKHVIFRARSSDGDYTSFLIFNIREQELVAPQSFVSGEFVFRPSLFNKRYEYKAIGKSKHLVQPCKIALSSYRDGSYYALTFNDTQSVKFAVTNEGVEEIGRTIRYGAGFNGIPKVVDIR